MRINFKQLCELIAQKENVSPDFWKKDPIYINFADNRSPGDVADSVPFSTTSADFVVDVDANGDALGIEFA